MQVQKIQWKGKEKRIFVQEIRSYITFKYFTNFLLHMAARKGKILAPGKYKPELKLSYQELVPIDEKFREELKRYMDIHTPRQARAELGLGPTAQNSYTSGKTRIIPRENYQRVASVLGINSEVEPRMVNGGYVGLILGLYFDSKNIKMRNAVETLAEELKHLDENFARKSEHAVRCAAHDILSIRRGSVPFSLLREYEDKLVHELNSNGTSLEQLMETLRTVGVDNLSDFEARLISVANLQKPYEFDGEHTTYDYFVGNKIVSPNFGQGEVIDKQPTNSPHESTYIITVKFNDGSIRKLMAGKRSS